ncbi:hypothetical protein OIDMADRAFT_32705 [Oidiodendron maius Zn]|uniref:Uncharacterized protein n=1 Tax=Oidiodendron maius (strain Zn) TaxID=913774 RepID=A0A0C3CCX4_OIDMZ|nr:hypothetical protein OIDMADRAFT_32705 [Oidiodendron maius Zn]
MSNRICELTRTPVFRKILLRLETGLDQDSAEYCTVFRRSALTNRLIRFVVRALSNLINQIHCLEDGNENSRSLEFMDVRWELHLLENRDYATNDRCQSRAQFLGVFT